MSRLTTLCTVRSIEPSSLLGLWDYVELSVEFPLHAGLWELLTAVDQAGVRNLPYYQG
jgi:hypothetical protein